MQPPQEPFASLGLSDKTAAAATAARANSSASAHEQQPRSASASSTVSSSYIPLLISSDASHGSSMSSSVVSVATDAASVSSSTLQGMPASPSLSVQNPFESVVGVSAAATATAAAPTVPSLTTATSTDSTSNNTYATTTRPAAPVVPVPVPSLMVNKNPQPQQHAPQHLMPQPRAATTVAAAVGVVPPLPPRMVSPAAIARTTLPASPSNTILATSAAAAAAASPPRPPLPSPSSHSRNGNEFSSVQQQQQQHQRQQQQQQQPHYDNDMAFDDDENTAPSSAANTEEQPSTISRFLESTKRRMTTFSGGVGCGNRRDSDDVTNENNGNGGALISGYLQKLGRNGKWQTRWFETDGECLSYYKSSKRSKLLATLDLQKVGLIEIDTDDKMEFSFRIQVLGRLYHLRAESRASCRDWVITLNRVKEARMEQGNVKLVGGGAMTSLSAMDLLSNRTSSQQGGTPRVVVVSNRQRTRAVDEEEHWDQLIRVDGSDSGVGGNMINKDPSDPATYNSHSRRSALSTAVVARWSKRHSSMQRLGTKLSKWARSVKKYSCAAVDMEGHHNHNNSNAVYLDRHVHPPGHDDKAVNTTAKLQQQQGKQQQPLVTHQDKGLSSWIDKEASVSAALSSGGPSSSTTPADAVASIKPMQLKDRSLSAASSDYDARMIS